MRGFSRKRRVRALKAPAGYAGDGSRRPCPGGGDRPRARRAADLGGRRDDVRLRRHRHGRRDAGRHDRGPEALDALRREPVPGQLHGEGPRRGRHLRPVSRLDPPARARRRDHLREARLPRPPWRGRDRERVREEDGHGPHGRRRGVLPPAAQGQGTVWLHGGGDFVDFDLVEGQTLQVDTGCMVMFEPTVDLRGEAAGRPVDADDQEGRRRRRGIAPGPHDRARAT